MILNIELVPSSCWFSNVRSSISKLRWFTISKRIRSQAYDICEICRSNSEESLDCHEVWEYDDKKQIQKLIKMAALCKNCHMVKHFGFAQFQGKGELAMQHLMKVNKLTKKQAIKYLNGVMEQWVERSKKNWKLDISHLSEYDINISELKGR